MIVPITYFTAYRDQPSLLIQQIEGLYTEDITSITIAELEKSYPNNTQAHLHMAQDILLYFEKFNTPVNITATTTNGATTVPNKTHSNLSKTTAILLSLFLGTLGAHRFYAGKPGTGLAQLFCSIMIIPFIVDGYDSDKLWAITLLLITIIIWMVVDLILICCGEFSDSENRKIR
jgi:TM2 domain-containing membrane protein YozV